MYQEFFAKSPLLALPILSLVVFITVFAAIIVRELRRGGHHDAERLPLEEEVRHG